MPTTGPRNSPASIRGYRSPFVNYPFTAQSLQAKLEQLERDYKTNPTVSRSVFVVSQMQKISDTYGNFLSALNDLSTQNLNLPIETILAGLTTAVGEQVPEPFGTLLKGVTVLFAQIGKQAQQEQLARLQKDAEYYVGQLTTLQQTYTAYQGELSRMGFIKAALIGIPALLLFLKFKRDGDRT